MPDHTCPWHTPGGPRPVRAMSTKELLDTVQPGNRPPPWTWDDEAAYIESQRCCCEGCHCGRSDPPGTYQRTVEKAMREAGEWIGRPAMLGHDGLLRDGHHRILAARHLGIETVMVEIVTWPLWWQNQAT